MNWKLAVVVVCGVVLTAGVSFGQEVDERAKHEKINAESATPVAEGTHELAIEATYRTSPGGKRGYFNNNYSRDPRPGGRVRTYTYDVRYTYGLMPDTDISVAAGYADIHDRLTDTTSRYGTQHGRGMGDLQVALKHRFFNEGGTSVAYIPGLTIPTGRHANASRGRLGPGQNFWSFDQKLALTHDAGDVSLNADLGYNLPFGRTRKAYSMQSLQPVRDVRGIVDANLGIGYQAVGPNIQPIAEIGYRREIISGGGDAVIVPASVGVIWSTDAGQRVKLAYEHPLTGRNATRSRAFTAGVTLPF